MRGIRSIVLTAILLVVACLSAWAAKPTVSAHGEFWSSISVNPVLRYDVQVAFNVQARDGRDHGSISIRYFHMDTGELVAVLVSADVFDLCALPGNGIAFWATVEVPKWDIPIGPFDTVLFQAYDAGDIDDFWVKSPVTLHLAPTRGKIVVR